MVVFSFLVKCFWIKKTSDVSKLRIISLPSLSLSIYLSFSFAHQRIAFNEMNVNAHTTEQQCADCHGSRGKSVV